MMIRYVSNVCVCVSERVFEEGHDNDDDDDDDFSRPLAG